MENPKQEFVYGPCMRNHALKLGGYVTDGCGEFFPTNDGSYCGACQCHQSFHQKMVVGGNGAGGDRKGECSNHTMKVETEVMEASEDGEEDKQLRQHQVVVQMSCRRKPRTKFDEEQKQRMFAFATRLGWRIHRSQWDEINRFCRQIGVSRNVFKVWLNNHKKR